jgi:hypothetical protein
MGRAGHCTRLLPSSAVLEGWRTTVPLRASTAALAARGVEELGRVGAHLLTRQVCTLSCAAVRLWRACWCRCSVCVRVRACCHVCC